MKVKAIRADVFKNHHYVKCANGGITERYDELFVVCPDGCYEFDADKLPENLVEIKTKHVRGVAYRYAEPVAPVSKGCVGWMAGGSLLYSSDGRFGGMPVKVHDRQETLEQYDLLSR